MPIQRKGHLKTQRECTHLQAKGMASGETKPAHTLVLNFQLPEPSENVYTLFEPPNLWYFVMTALAS